jgi:hypothetical protein
MISLRNIDDFFVYYVRWVQKDMFDHLFVYYLELPPRFVIVFTVGTLGYGS